MFNFLKHWFSKPSVKTEIYKVPYTFITNPPAAELTRINRKIIDDKQAEETKKRKIEERKKFIEDIDNLELIIDTKIKESIKNGAYTISINNYDDHINKYYFNKGTVKNYLAAKRFRKRGFNIRLIRRSDIKYPYMSYDRIIPNGFTVYWHEVIISWS